MAERASPLTPSSTTIDSPMVPDSDSQSLSEDEIGDTKSLTASIIDYPIYFGRRYHRYKEGSYLYPNDEHEKERLDLQHSVLNHLLNNRLFYAPLDKDLTRKVLDIGTGTGIWPIELADSDQLPNATITGTDLSAIQPEEVPENVMFEIHDCSESDWGRPLSSLDYVHARFMAGSLTSYSDMIRTARKYLKPGTGWFECQEVDPEPLSDDGTMPKEWKLAEWSKNLEYSSNNLDPPRPVRVADKLKKWMEHAGYVDVHEHVCKIPMGAWPRDKTLKQIGQWWQRNWISGLAAFSYKLFGDDGLGWSRDEIELELAAVRSALVQKEVHSYQRYYIVYGRRPDAEEDRMLRRGLYV